MTNFEKYIDEIIENKYDTLTKDFKFARCVKIKCEDCLFYKDEGVTECTLEFVKWLKEKENV